MKYYQPSRAHHGNPRMPLRKRHYCEATIRRSISESSLLPEIFFFFFFHVNWRRIVIGSYGIGQILGCWNCSISCAIVVASSRSRGSVVVMATVLNAVGVDARRRAGRETALRTHPAAVIVDVLQIEGMYMSREITIACQHGLP